MKQLRLRLSEAAVNDIVEQAEWYEEQADRQLSKRWEQAVQAALMRIIRSPGSGSMCEFEATELSRVRRSSVFRSISFSIGSTVTIY